MRHILTLALVTTALAGSAGADALRDKALEMFKPLPSTVPAVKDNPVTPDKIALGKALFFDPRLSASGARSAWPRASSCDRTKSARAGVSKHGTRSPRKNSNAGACSTCRSEK